MLILASNSPRRKELLRKLGIPFTVIASSADETPVQLACDTVVILDGEVLGKPKDENDAVKMLMKEQGRKQVVLTGYTYLTERKEITRSVASYVYFNPLSEEEARNYVKKYRPYDKAGAYGIQDEAGLINHVEGSYYNVMGFPLEDIAFRIYGRDPKSLL